MKLRFERFEGLSCLSVRGELANAHLKVLEIGIETLCKALEEPLIINMTLSHYDEAITKELRAFKKRLPSLTKEKIYWVAAQKGLADYLNIGMLTARLTGFKLRQIGEYIKLEDDVFVLQSRTELVENRVKELGKDENLSQRVILENRILKAQERVLKEAIHWQEIRMKLQTKIPVVDLEIVEKTTHALAEFKKNCELKVDL